MDRIAKIKEFLKVNEKDNFLRHALALEYLKINEEALAKELFIAIITDSPHYVGTYYHQAKLLEKLGDHTAAIHCYENGMIIAKELKDQHSYNELQAAYEDLVY